MLTDYKDLIIVIIGLILASMLHTFGTFGYKYWGEKGKSGWFILLIGIFFGILSYIVKIPLFYYYAKQNVVLTYIMSISILAIIVCLFSKFILKEQIKTHTYITLLLVLILVSYNEYLSFNDKKYENVIKYANY